MSRDGFYSSLSVNMIMSNFEAWVGAVSFLRHDSANTSMLYFEESFTTTLGFNPICSTSIQQALLCTKKVPLAELGTEALHVLEDCGQFDRKLKLATTSGSKQMLVFPRAHCWIKDKFDGWLQRQSCMHDQTPNAQSSKRCSNYSAWVESSHWSRLTQTAWGIVLIQLTETQSRVVKKSE